MLQQPATKLAELEAMVDQKAQPGDIDYFKWQMLLHHVIKLATDYRQQSLGKGEQKEEQEEDEEQSEEDEKGEQGTAQAEQEEETEEEEEDADEDDEEDEEEEGEQYAASLAGTRSLVQELAVGFSFWPTIIEHVYSGRVRTTGNWLRDESASRWRATKRRIRRVTALIGIAGMFVALGRLMDRNIVVTCLVKTIGTAVGAGLMVFIIGYPIYRLYQDPFRSIRTLFRIFGIKLPKRN